VISLLTLSTSLRMDRSDFRRALRAHQEKVRIESYTLTVYLPVSVVTSVDGTVLDAKIIPSGLKRLERQFKRDNE